MKVFKCRCGHSVYFESHVCLACGALLGFHVPSLEMRSLDDCGDGTLVDGSGERFGRCRNAIEYGSCNWLTNPGESPSFCTGCSFNRTIPNLSESANVARWAKFEVSKKRLLYTLFRLRLPVRNGVEDPRSGLLFDFVEDSRSNSERFPETFVHTGFLGGVITINALEADDPVREAIKAQMGESYRTVLGHLRHESGHYYWSVLDANQDETDRFNALFGRIDTDYAAALEAYYANGPASDWPARHISAYASAHPVEDWAECWAHYLFIVDALETAAAHGVSNYEPDGDDMRETIASWRRFSIVLNELNRSIGIGDAYPFVVNAIVEEKLVYVDEVVRRLRTRHSEKATR